jgi:hypothetical protein
MLLNLAVNLIERLVVRFQIKQFAILGNARNHNPFPFKIHMNPNLAADCEAKIGAPHDDFSPEPCIEFIPRHMSTH